MRILLVSMPDTVSGLDAIMRVPSLGLCSLAGNLDGHETRVLDLALVRRPIEPVLRKLLGRLRPVVVGISAMSFQYESARRVATIVRDAHPQARTVLGGYHATLTADEIGAEPDAAALFDFLVRGEGERTFGLLLDSLANRSPALATIPGLSFRQGGRFVHNPAAPLLDLSEVRLPRREARILDTPRFMNLRFDCAETSRGCTMGCAFCSIRAMYGRSVRFYAVDRVIEDLRSLARRGTRGVFFVDDNITLNVSRLKELCRRIASEGLSGMYYVMQASVAGIASDLELPRLLAKANVRWIFLGIESGIARNLAEMRKTGVLDNARKAVRRLRAQGTCVIGGFIAGNPDDTRGDIRDTYRYALSLGVDHAIVQLMTPYPKTQTRERMLADGLVTNARDFARYTGFQANVRTRSLSARRLARWTVLYGLPLYFSPYYILRSRVWWYRPADAPQMLLNNFRFVASGLRGRLFASRHRF